MVLINIMGVPLKDLDSNHFDNDRFKNFNIPIGLFVFLISKPFNFDKLNNLDDKIDIEELELILILMKKIMITIQKKIHLLILFL